MRIKNIHHFSRQVVEILPLLFREFSRREDNELTRGKITFPQMVTLDHVGRRGEVQMNELSKLHSVRKSSVTVLVNRLISQKMLKRRHDLKDRRVVWVSITPKGKKVVAQILNQKRKSIEAIFNVLTAQERAQYLSTLLKIKSSILENKI